MTRPAPTVTVPDAKTVCATIAPYLGATDANDWAGLEDDDAISMTVKMRVGDLRALKAVAAAPAAPQAAGVGKRVAKACADFQEAIDYFEADVADVMAEGSERADLWDREVTVNIDALKAVMNAALRAPSREPEGGAVRPPDEMTENALRGRAKALLKLKGWRAGDKIHIHGMIELLTQFGMDVTAHPEEDRCGYPDCGCDFDEVCDAALATREEASAEAGEASLVDWFSQFIERHQEGCGSDTDALIACLDRVRDSYRAPPQAREDAQPVAWTEDMERERREADYERGFRHGKKSVLEDARPTRWGLVDASGRMLALTYESADEASSMGRRCPTVVLTPTALYTHPAPDALRAKGEELVKALKRYGFPVSGAATVNLGAFGSSEAMAVDFTTREFIKALAALQAEQGAK